MKKNYEFRYGKKFIVYEYEDGDTVENLKPLCTCGCGKIPFMNNDGKRKMLEMTKETPVGVFSVSCGF